MIHLKLLPGLNQIMLELIELISLFSIPQTSLRMQSKQFKMQGQPTLTPTHKCKVKNKLGLQEFSPHQVSVQLAVNLLRKYYYSLKYDFNFSSFTNKQFQHKVSRTNRRANAKFLRATTKKNNQAVRSSLQNLTQLLAKMNGNWSLLRSKRY